MIKIHRAGDVCGDGKVVWLEDLEELIDKVKSGTFSNRNWATILKSELGLND